MTTPENPEPYADTLHRIGAELALIAQILYGETQHILTIQARSFLTGAQQTLVWLLYRTAAASPCALYMRRHALDRDQEDNDAA